MAAAASPRAEDAPMVPPGERRASIFAGLVLVLLLAALRRLLERIVARAGVDLSPAAAWLLARFDESSEATPDALARTYEVDAGRLFEALGELRRKRLVAKESHTLTPAGREVLERLRAARRAGLAELLADWSPEPHRDLSDFLRRVAGDLARETPT